MHCRPSTNTGLVDWTDGLTKLPSKCSFQCRAEAYSAYHFAKVAPLACSHQFRLLLESVEVKGHMQNCLQCGAEVYSAYHFTKVSPLACSHQFRPLLESVEVKGHMQNCLQCAAEAYSYHFTKACSH